MTDPTTAADRLRKLADERRLTPELFHAYLDEALAEAAAPYRTALERLVETWDLYGTTEVNSWGDEAVHEPWLAAIREARALLRREVGE